MTTGSIKWLRVRGPKPGDGDLPEVLRPVVNSLGYKKHQIGFVCHPAEDAAVEIHEAFWDGGSKPWWVLVHLSTGETSPVYLREGCPSVHVTWSPTGFPRFAGRGFVRIPKGSVLASGHDGGTGLVILYARDDDLPNP